jgi:hypothetical protein
MNLSKVSSLSRKIEKSQRNSYEKICSALFGLGYLFRPNPRRQASGDTDFKPLLRLLVHCSQDMYPENISTGLCRPIASGLWKLQDLLNYERFELNILICIKQKPSG